VQLLLLRLLLAVVTLGAGGIFLRDALQIGVTVRRDRGIEPLGALLFALCCFFRSCLAASLRAISFLFMQWAKRSARWRSTCLAHSSLSCRNCWRLPREA
jgi:hypothetical protein